MSPAFRIPLPFNDVFTLRDVHARGLTEHALRGWLSRGEVLRMGNGVFVPRHVAADARLARLWPNWLTRDGLRILTVQGAAERHGIATPPQVPPAHFHGRQRRVIPDRFVVQEGPWLVPTAAWTAVSLARWQRVEPALIPLDCALHKGVSRDDLDAVVATMESWPGARMLGRALDLADARAESPLESLSRGHIITAKLPKPSLQFEIRVKGNLFRCDMAWESLRIIGEADGIDKYTGRQAVMDEKRRQSMLQAAGFTVLRWTWQDVYPDPRAWLAGLRSALQ